MARSILICTESLMLVPEHIFLLLRLFYQRKPPCTLWRWLVRDTALVYSVVLWSIHPDFTHRSYGKHRYPKSSTWAKTELWENLQFVKSEQEEMLMIRRKFIYATILGYRNYVMIMMRVVSEWLRLDFSVAPLGSGTMMMKQRRSCFLPLPSKP